ncbi:hypothetical protein HN587_02675 [Candidatus Woesearchaeota archaeon]|jgi:phosphate uptake regulator|nr:hypothetical protein [Candidatus Woesearchaeota archaeon]
MEENIIKRRLIKQGKGGYTVTVPIDFVRNNDLEAGTEIRFIPLADGLLMSATATKPKKEITFTLEDNDKTRLRTIISSFYRRGYDTITLKTTDPISFSRINKITESLLGLVATEHTENNIILQNMMKDDFEDVEKIITKLCYTVKHFNKLVLEDLTDKSTKNEEIKSLRKTTMKLRDYCQRMITTTNYQKDKSQEYNLLVFTIEKIASNFYNFHLNKKELNKKQKIINELNTLNDIFSDLFEIYRKKDSKKIVKANQKIFIQKRDLNVNHPLILVLKENLFTLSSRITGLLLS